MFMVGKIRRMHVRDGKSVREIARRTGLSRNTVKAWLRAPEDEVPRYRRTERSGKLTPFHTTLLTALEADALRPKKARRTGLALYRQIQTEGYGGGYSRVTDFIRAWRAESGASARAFVPLQFAPGEAFEFDWSEESLNVGGVVCKVQVAHMKLCASRAFWLVAYPGQSHEMLFDAHTRSFQALGGIPRRGIYDNMRTAVDRIPGRGKQRVVNARFAAMCAHYLFEADFCNVASGWEKGRVEKDVQDSRRRIWVVAQEQRFSSFEALNAWLGDRCRALWATLKHPEHPALTIAQMLDHERRQLMPMPAPFDGYAEKPARVSSTCLVTVARNCYSVPCELAGQLVSVHQYSDRIAIVAGEVVVAQHARCRGRGQTAYDWQHYVPLLQRKPGALRNGAPFADLPTPLQRLRRALLREPGGDRVMAQILALVPKAGLEAVLIAVEQALAAALPSGRLSVEHVQNVLARLQEPPTPPSVATTLKATIPPRADPARYDRLREVTHG